MSKELVYVTAEIGVNYNGDRDLLDSMVEDCISAKVDAVKLQLFDETVIKDYAPYDKQILSKMFLGPAEVAGICERVHSEGVELVVTPMYLEAFEWLKDIPVDGIKIRAKDWCNDEIYNATRGYSGHVYTSVPYIGGGIENQTQIPNILEKFSRTRGHDRHRVFCIPRYPPAKKDLNLFMVKDFDGCSLHSPDWYEHYAAAVINLEHQYINNRCRRFYLEAHVMPTGRRAWARPDVLDGPVSIWMGDLEKLVVACKDLEETIGVV